MSSQRVAAAVIWSESRVLLCQRPSHKRHGGLWEFPGGKLEPDETLGDALRRELAEELHLEVLSVGTKHVSIAEGDSRFLIEFVEVEVDGIPEPSEHDQTAWVLPTEAVSYPLAPADRLFVTQHLLEER